MSRSLVGSLTLSLALMALFVSPARAAVLCVNPGGTDGCHPTIQGAIAAATHGDVIKIAAGTYHEKIVMHVPNNKSLIIQGAGPEKTIVDGTGVPSHPTAPVFQFQNDPPVGPVVTVQDLTIMGGYRGVDAGRGVKLTLQNVVVRNNGPGSGAGVFNNSSAVTIINSTIRDNVANDNFFGCDASGGTGGGIAKLCGGGSYIIINTAVVNNTARAGGGAVFVNASTTIINSTFSGNRLTDPNGIGAAMMNFSEVMYMHHTTIADNTSINPAGGALAMFSLRNEMQAVLLQGNAGSNCFAGEPLHSTGYNVSSDASCALAGPGDLVNAAVILGPLQDNGGPTPTHALSPGPGLNHVPTSICPAPAADQRGVARAQGVACDTGAYEAEDETGPVITVPGAINTNATSPAGAVVHFAASATDDFDGSVPVTCAPASGSVFPIGLSTVTCTAADAAGNGSTASFDVLVGSASQQLQALRDLLVAVDPGFNLFAFVRTAQKSVAEGKTSHACASLSLLQAEVDRIIGNPRRVSLSPADAAAITAAVADVRASLGCQ